MPEKSLLSFEQLSTIANSLNKASDELTRVVSVLDEALQRLNVGLVVWVLVVKWHDENGLAYDCEQVGYAKVNGVWGIAIRKLFGSEDSPDPDEVREVWAFNDAPRELRLRAVEKLPDVVDQLAKAAIETTELLNKKLVETRGFAAAIGLLQPSGPQKEGSAKGRKS
jgi:hypothetical protein